VRPRCMTGRAPLVLLLVLMACASRAEPPLGAAAGGEQPYEVTATVLQSPQHGPQLCFAVAESLPPQCGGADVTPFDWATVDGEQSLNGTTWGAFHLVGTYDGTAFHPTERPGPPRQPSPVTNTYPSPCGSPPPADRARTTPADWAAVQSWAQAQPDFAGLWLTWPNGVPSEDAATDPQAASTTVVFAFTAPPEQRRPDVVAHWGGSICVLRLAHAYRTLRQAQDDLTAHRAEAKAAGIDVLSVNVDTRANVLAVEAMVATPAGQGWLDERYGAGRTALSGALRPVPWD
jgi:hypothetical protein